MELALIVVAVFAVVAIGVMALIVDMTFSEMKRRDLADRAQTNMLLERIQRPEVPLELVTPTPANLPAKLWKNEQDEIDESRQAIRIIEELEAERLA